MLEELKTQNCGQRTSQTCKVGYFVGRFPEQTHVFFWREIRALGGLGIEAEILSTRRPRENLMPHSWTVQAVASTQYLMPVRLSLVLGGTLQFLRSGPRGWMRCIRGIVHAEGYSLFGRARLVALAGLGAQVAWLARRRGWRHLHVHKCGDPASIAMFASFVSGITYSMTLHNRLEDDGPGQKEKWRRAAFAIVVSRDRLAEVNDRLAGHLPEVLEVAPMGIDLGACERSTPYVPWNGIGPCVIFSCGRLNPVKGHDTLIRSVALLRKQGTDAKLRIAGGDDTGTGRRRDHLQRLIDELSLDDVVTLLGSVPEEVVRAELETAHVFALASLSEGLPVAVMEAMAMEVPVAMTRVGGAAELIDDGADGLLIEPGDPEALAAAMAKILHEPALARRLSGASRRKISASYHSGINAQALARCLQAAGAVTGIVRGAQRHRKN